MILPDGLHGGEDGKRGQTELLTVDGKKKKLPGKFSIAAGEGDRIVIETPGGGGCGTE